MENDVLWNEMLRNWKMNENTMSPDFQIGVVSLLYEQFLQFQKVLHVAMSAHQIYAQKDQEHVKHSELSVQYHQSLVLHHLIPLVRKVGEDIKRSVEGLTRGTREMLLKHFESHQTYNKPETTRINTKNNFQVIVDALLAGNARVVDNPPHESEMVEVTVKASETQDKPKQSQVVASNSDGKKEASQYSWEQEKTKSESLSLFKCSPSPKDSLYSSMITSTDPNPSVHLHSLTSSYTLPLPSLLLSTPIPSPTSHYTFQAALLSNNTHLHCIPSSPLI